jgi:lipopolysaccharide transport system ATP-binding protein
VAAHLEPEILIVDEVLAVGDAQFQKKCLGKMEDVSKGEGRTILFVSHNMGIVSQLCNKGILLNKGRVETQGKVVDIIDRYVNLSGTSLEIYESNKTDKQNTFLKIYSSDGSEAIKSDFAFNEQITLNIAFRCDFSPANQQIGIGLNDKFNNRVFTLLRPVDSFAREGEMYKGSVTLPAELIAPNYYSFVFALWSKSGEVYDLVENVCRVKVHDNGTDLANYENIDYGSIIVRATWS